MRLQNGQCKPFKHAFFKHETTSRYSVAFATYRKTNNGVISRYSTCIPVHMTMEFSGV